MKTTRTLLLATLLALVLAACGTPAAPTSQVDLPSQTATPAPQVANVSFADPALEALIRATLGKTEGEISVMEAEAITRLDLSNEWQDYLSAEPAITQIGGLENFSNLEYLDLSSHAISDISALEGLTDLTFLALGGNPVAELGSLSKLTNLKVLDLSNSVAEDYSPLAALDKLETLIIKNSSLTDVTPLTSLINLRHLFLANSQVNDYSPLLDVFPNLEGRDFTIVTTLEELGFWMDEGRRTAIFESDEAFIAITHTEWGAPPADWEANSIQSSTYLEGDTKMGVRYYPEHKAYAVYLARSNEPGINYLIDPTGISISASDAEASERYLREGMEVREGEEALRMPIRFFEDSIQNAFNMSVDNLFGMPYAPKTLKNLSFFPDPENAIVKFEWREGQDVNIEVHIPEWGEKEYDVQFFTPISDEYRIVINYISATNSFGVGVDDNDLGGVFFEYFADTQEIIDHYCSDGNLTVEEYLMKAYNDPAIEDVHLHSIQLMEQFLRAKFDLTVEELFTLPTGEYKELME